MTEREWVFMGPEPHLAHCVRCGRTEPKPPMPIAIDYAAAWLDAAVKRHRGCVAQQPSPPSPSPDWRGRGERGGGVMAEPELSLDEWMETDAGKAWKAQYELEQRRHKRGVWEVRDEDGAYLSGYVCGEEISQGGWYETGGRLANWMTKADLDAFRKRCWQRSDETGVRHKRYPDYIVAQCGGCKWFGALNADWGFCMNAASPLDGRVVFEHGGCAEHSELSRILAAEGGS